MKAPPPDPRTMTTAPAFPSPAADRALPAWAGFALLCLASLAPLLVVGLPPLTDLYGHLGRFAIQTELAQRPALQPFFSYDWKLIGNLGSDLLVEALHPLLGLEGSVRAAVLLTQLLASAGVLAVSRAVHGRITPFAIAALPLIYGYPFNFGFLNFSLGMALALLAFAGWLTLRAGGRGVLAGVWLALAGAAIWLCHTYGWVFLGLLAGSTMLAEVWAARTPPLRAVLRILAACWPLLLPLVPMLLWRASADAGGGAVTGDWSAGMKLVWLISALRTRWMVPDLGGALFLAGLVYWTTRRHAGAVEARTGVAAVLCALGFLVLPMNVFGSAFADMRLAPYAFIVALLALSPAALAPRARQVVGALALAFFAIRMVTTGLAYTAQEREVAAHLPALDAMPQGARVAFLVVKPCEAGWPLPVLDHLGSLALVRRNVFANDQWDVPGMNPLRVHYPPAGAYARDPSQAVLPDGCPADPARTLSRTLAALPLGAFTHVWIVGELPKAMSVPAGLTPVPVAGKGRLYAVKPAA